MGAFIRSVVARRARGGPLAPGALQLSEQVARECLDEGRRSAEELDLLVNAGLYKEKNLAEPAMAAIIQEDIGANPGHPPRADRHGTFSFDVMNGGCGVLSALHVVDGFVRGGTAQLGLIVAADTDPDPRTSHGYPFAPVGGALLLEHERGDGEIEGFAGFEFASFAEDAELFEVRVRFEPGAGGVFGHRGHPALDVREDPRFAPRCVEHATTVSLRFLDRVGLLVKDVDLLIASGYPRRFDRELATTLGISPRHVPELPPELAGAHTAGPLAALATASRNGQLALARRVLFVTVGAGITVGVALYRKAG